MDKIANLRVADSKKQDPEALTLQVCLIGSPHFTIIVFRSAHFTFQDKIWDLKKSDDPI
jgi:hypothetical protein